jgi:hypothetical protein
MADIGSLRPRLLIHGHTTLTEQFTAEAVPGLQAALTQLHGQVLDGIRDGRTLPDILQEASLPAVLREHPTAVVPCPADHPAGPAPPPASTTLAGTRWRRRAQPPAHPVAAQDAGLDAARETGVGTKPPEGRGSAGLTERLAAASARRARRVLAAEMRK